MKKFIDSVAEKLFEVYGEGISRFSFVFPNRRAGLFFKKRLGELIERPLLVPRITTINELVADYSERRSIDRTQLLFMLYEAYVKVKRDQGVEAESFDRFLFWGEIILSDFDDVDKWMVDPRQLFENIQDLKELEQDRSYLSDEQVELITQFWDTFFVGIEVRQGEKSAEAMERFLESWKLLYPLYVEFRALLDREGVAYEGMIYREVAEKLNQGELVCTNDECVFVGLNAFTRSEELFLEHLTAQGLADFYWDYELPDLKKDPTNRAGYYANANLRRFPSRHTINYLFPKERPKIELYAVPSSVGQAKEVYSILQRLADESPDGKPDALNTAVILPEESFLLPILSYLPESYDEVNVTMGYGLRLSGVAGLMNELFEMHRSAERYGKFYHVTLLPVLNHPIVQRIDGAAADELGRSIVQFNQVYIPSEPFAEGCVLNRIFRLLRWEDSRGEYLHEVLDLVGSVTQLPHEEDEEPDEMDLAVTTQRMEAEFIFHYKRMIDRLDRLIGEVAFTIEQSTYFRLVRSLVDGVSIPFEGEPLAGLQIMGVLETRGLDFRNVIITSMNEGTFPKRNSANSFIPYNLRRGFGMSVMDHQEAIYAYHFYRLIARAERLFFLYDTRAGENRSSSEVSRYVHQLRYLYGYEVEEVQQEFVVSVEENPTIMVEKSEQILRRINAFRQGGERAFSATALKNLIDCPLRFYFSEIEQMRENEEVSEELQESTFGNIYHKTMEQLYGGDGLQQGERSSITRESLNQLLQKPGWIAFHIRKGFEEFYYKFKGVPDQLPANLRLIAGLIQEYVVKTIRSDMEKTPFYIVGAEKKLRATLDVAPDLQVNIKGTIDRIDYDGRALRLIDYKSGKVDLTFDLLDRLFIAQPRRPYQLFQVLFYGLLMEEEKEELQAILGKPYSAEEGCAIEPHIIALRNLKNNETGVMMKPDRKTTLTPAETYRLTRQEYRARLNEVIASLFDPKIPFRQTSVAENCTYCAFTTICKRVGK